MFEHYPPPPQEKNNKIYMNKLNVRISLINDK